MTRYYLHGDYDDQINQYYCCICHHPNTDTQGFFSHKQHFLRHSYEENMKAYEENLTYWKEESTRDSTLYRVETGSAFENEDKDRDQTN